MIRRALSLGAVAAVMTLAGNASAGDWWGRQGDFSWGLERTMGIYFVHQEFEREPLPDAEFDFNAFEVGLTAGPVGVGGVYSKTPRLALDFFVIDNLSLGGGIGFASYGDDADATIFLFNPRVGYYIGLGDVAGFWPRGGFTYWSASTPGDDDPDQLMLTLEAMFTLTPKGRAAIELGPVVDFGFAGEQFDNDRNDTVFGLAVGMKGLM